jgi:hypothetical protein
MICAIRKQRGFASVRFQRRESAMSEAEFNRLLDAVRAAVAPLPQEEEVLFAHLPVRSTPPKLANDNQLA